MLPVPGVTVDEEEGVGSNSGATLRNHEIVLMALASFREFVLSEDMRFVAISCIASSAWDETEDINGESGYRVCRRRMCAFRSNADA